jgi:hypothetical protein
VHGDRRVAGQRREIERRTARRVVPDHRFVPFLGPDHRHVHRRDDQEPRPDLRVRIGSPGNGCRAGSKRSREPATDPAHSLADRFGIQVEQVLDEDVRMHRPDPEWRERRLRKVPEIEGNDLLRSGTDGCRENVAVLRIRQYQRRFERLVTGHLAIEDRGVHQRSDPFEARALPVGPTDHDGADPLLMDPLRPLRPAQARPGELHEQIAYRRRVKDARVVDDREGGHGVISSPVRCLATARRAREAQLRSRCLDDA